jgi:hypothetical protein
MPRTSKQRRHLKQLNFDKGRRAKDVLVALEKALGAEFRRKIHTDGYLIVEHPRGPTNAVNSPITVTRWKNASLKRATGLFQAVDVEGTPSDGDGLRRMAPLRVARERDKDPDFVPALAQNWKGPEGMSEEERAEGFEAALESTSRTLASAERFGQEAVSHVCQLSGGKLIDDLMTALIALEGCDVQPIHIDGTLGSNARKRAKAAAKAFKNGKGDWRVPLSILIVLEPGTTFSVMPGSQVAVWSGRIEDFQKLELCKLILRPGQIIVFRQDVIHSGDAYASDNLRLHAYLDHPHVVRPSDTTTPLHSLWDSDWKITPEEWLRSRSEKEIDVRDWKSGSGLRSVFEEGVKR